jgi:ABC-type amino acid transport substrate-binding protein
MVWKGHYLGYGPADVMLHVPVDRMLMNANPQVNIFAPYHVETVRLVRSARSIPDFESTDALAGKRIGVEKGVDRRHGDAGRGQRTLPRPGAHLPDRDRGPASAQGGKLDAVLATRSEIESVLRGDPAFPVQEVAFDRLPRSGWAIGMAVRKEQVELARKLQAAMNDMGASGELRRLFARYGVQVVKP